MYKILDDISKWSIEKRIRQLERIYKERMGVELDIYNPKRFTEKVQWMKIYYSSSEIIRCIDKVSFKDYIYEHLGKGYTAQICKVWHTPEEVCLDDLPPTCVIKSNCSSEGQNVHLITDWKDVDKGQLTREIKETWFDRRILCTNSFITAYHHVTPVVFVEELIPGFSDSCEYKIYCFNGEPKCLFVPGYQFNQGVKKGIHAFSFYSINWEFMNFSMKNHEYFQDLDRPENLDQMVELARKLAKDFMFVRVDFINTPSNPYITEMTFYPSGGLIPFQPIESDYLLGSWLQLDMKYIKESRGG